MDNHRKNPSQQSWQHRGQQRPSFALEPGPGQESVWDYPRPPICVPERRHIQVKLGDVVIANTHSAIRVLETASPPTFYIPPEDTRLVLLTPEHGETFCEWKGQARYFPYKSKTSLSVEN